VDADAEMPLNNERFAVQRVARGATLVRSRCGLRAQVQAPTMLIVSDSAAPLNRAALRALQCAKRLLIAVNPRPAVRQQHAVHARRPRRLRPTEGHTRKVAEFITEHLHAGIKKARKTPAKTASTPDWQDVEAFVDKFLAEARQSPGGPARH
jgi:hypothetical protein